MATNYGAFSDTTASPTVMKVQGKLATKGLFPGVVDGKFDIKLVTALETFFGSMPTTLKEAAPMFGKLNVDAPAAAGSESMNLTPEEMGLLSVAYLAFKDVNGGIGYKIRKNLALVIVGAVVLTGGVVGGVWYWKKHKSSGGAHGLGCPCSLGHGGRTTSYRFPSGKKHGHYRTSTGRFHAHA